MKVGDIVEVEWYDAVGSTGDGWDALSVALEAELVKVDTVGYLVKKTRRALTLIQSSNAFKHIDHFIVIPTAWIHCTTVLVPDE